MPSLTEAIAPRPAALVGATEWCTHPADLDVPRVRGTKNPDRRGSPRSRPTWSCACKEENRELDVRRLRGAGRAVWVGDVESVEQAVGCCSTLRRRARLGAAGLADRGGGAWAGPGRSDAAAVAVPIWRDPWMVVGARTFTGDLVAPAGRGQPLRGGPRTATRGSTWPELDPAGADLVLLPDEPYVFTDEDGPEAFTRTPDPAGERAAADVVRPLVERGRSGFDVTPVSWLTSH